MRGQKASLDLLKGPTVISKRIHLSKKTRTEDLLQTIGELNDDQHVHGILLQHPVPPSSPYWIITTFPSMGSMPSLLEEVRFGQTGFHDAVKL